MPFNCHGWRRQESRDKQTLGNPTSKRWTRNFKVDDAILIVIFFIRTPAWNGSLTGVFGGIISEPVYAFCSSFAAALPKAKRYILKKKTLSNTFTFENSVRISHEITAVCCSNQWMSTLQPASSIKRGAWLGGRHGGLLTYTSADLRFFWEWWLWECWCLCDLYN